MSFVSRGFRGRRRPEADAGRVPPGQYLDRGLPGALGRADAAHAARASGRSPLVGAVDEPRRWTGTSSRRSRARRSPTDIHCVTKWTKLDTDWEGVSVDTLLDGRRDARPSHVLAFCDGGYTTNLPLEDVTDGKAWVAFGYDGEPLAPEHGGPARLLVPHLYFWKSAKWVRGLRAARTTTSRASGSRYGYHNYGDPWREQRYAGD